MVFECREYSYSNCVLIEQTQSKRSEKQQNLTNNKLNNCVCKLVIVYCSMLLMPFILFNMQLGFNSDIDLRKNNFFVTEFLALSLSHHIFQIIVRQVANLCVMNTWFFGTAARVTQLFFLFTNFPCVHEFWTCRQWAVVSEVLKTVSPISVVCADSDKFITFVCETKFCMDDEAWQTTSIGSDWCRVSDVYQMVKKSRWIVNWKEIFEFARGRKVASHPIVILIAKNFGNCSLL